MSAGEQQKETAAAAAEETNAISWEQLAEATDLPEKEANDVLGTLIDELMGNHITVDKSVLKALKKREEAIGCHCWLFGRKAGRCLLYLAHELGSTDCSSIGVPQASEAD